MHQMCDVSAVVGVDAELELRNPTAAQNRIVSQWRVVSADEQHNLRDRVDEILRPLGFEIKQLVMERAKNIALCFICPTLSSVVSLRDHWRSQRLRGIVKDLFTLLSGLARDRRDIKRLTWPFTDYERCLNVFSTGQGKQITYK